VLEPRGLAFAGARNDFIGTLLNPRSGELRLAK
jgi:hypothetical protein